MSHLDLSKKSLKLLDLMELVTGYESSSSDSDREFQVEGTPTFELPRIPSEVLDKYHIGPNIDKYLDEEMLRAAKNNSRIFTGFIYFECRPTTRTMKRMSQYIFDVNQTIAEKSQTARPLQFEPLFYSELGSPMPLHISLSTSLSFRNEDERIHLYNAFADKLKHLKVKETTATFEPKPLILFTKDTQTVFLTLQVTNDLQNGLLTEIRSNLEDAMVATGHVDGKDSKPLKKLPLVDTYHVSLAKCTNTTFDDQCQQLQKVSLPFWNHQLPEFKLESIKCDINRQAKTIQLLK